MDKIIIAASTHWDREWYRTFQEFQIRLCDLMNQLLDLLEQDSDFLCYTFDGQSVVLDDYLEIYPENRGRIEKLTAEGRLIFGPLYNLPDEFLSGGEALIRNFQMGDAVCKAFGKKLNAGYVPDNFGHISQLPQILKGVGLEHAFFFRGTNLDTVKAKEFYWEGADGSRVLSEYMLLGYWSLKSWGRMEKGVVEHFKEVYDTLKAHAALPVFLMVNGSDHLYQDSEFTEKVKEVREAFSELEIINGSFEDYSRLALKAAREASLTTVRGELRDFRYGPDPTSVTSTRNRIKKLLFRTLAEGERYAEPLAAMAAARNRSYHYQAGFFEKAWKKVLVSLGHDGITGCSTDETTADIAGYLTHAGQIFKRIRELAFSSLLEQEKEPKEQYLALFNPNPWPYSGVTRQVVHLTKESEAEQYRDFVLRNAAGEMVPYEIEGVWEDVITKEFLYNSKERVYRRCVQILFPVKEVPACGVDYYHIEKSKLLEKREEEFYIRSRASEKKLENEYYIITPNSDASIDIYDKKEQKWYRNMHNLVARGEAGDEYQHVSPLFDRHVFPILTGIHVVKNSPLSQSMELSAVMKLPRARAVKELGQELGEGSIGLTTKITLYQGGELIEFQTVIDNTCQDFILYAGFPLQMEEARDYSYVSFDEVFRDNKVYAFDDSLKSTQSFAKPMQRYSGVVGRNQRFDLVTKGIYEYHTKETEEGTDYYLTLLRSTGYLFHGLPLSWKDGQHSTTPIVETADSRELGISVCEYGISLNRQNIQRLFEEYCYPILGEDTLGRGEAFSFLEIESEKVRLSACKSCVDGNGIILRLYQTGTETVHTRIRTMLPIERVSICNLLEEETAEHAHELHGIPVEIGPKKIVTLKIKWGLS